MRPVLPVAALLVLAACATTNDLAATEPDQVEISSKPIDEVSRCLQLLADKPERIDPQGRRFIQIVNGLNHTLATLTLIPIEEGTRIELRRANSINVPGPWRRCV